MTPPIKEIKIAELDAVIAEKDRELDFVRNRLLEMTEKRSQAQENFERMRLKWELECERFDQLTEKLIKAVKQL